MWVRTGSGTGSVHLPVRFAFGTGIFRKCEWYLLQSGPKTGPNVCASVRTLIEINSLLAETEITRTPRGAGAKTMELESAISLWGLPRADASRSEKNHGSGTP